jgi:hypothetical protein
MTRVLAQSGVRLSESEQVQQCRFRCMRSNGGGFSLAFGGVEGSVGTTGDKRGQNRDSTSPTYMRRSEAFSRAQKGCLGTGTVFVENLRIRS